MVIVFIWMFNNGKYKLIVSGVSRVIKDTFPYYYFLFVPCDLTFNNITSSDRAILGVAELACHLQNNSLNILCNPKKLHFAYYICIILVDIVLT